MTFCPFLQNHIQLNLRSEIFPAFVLIFFVKKRLFYCSTMVAARDGIQHLEPP